MSYWGLGGGVKVAGVRNCRSVWTIVFCWAWGVLMGAPINTPFSIKKTAGKREWKLCRCELFVILNAPFAIKITFVHLAKSLRNDTKIFLAW